MDKLNDSIDAARARARLRKAGADREYAVGGAAAERAAVVTAVDNGPAGRDV